MFTFMTFDFSDDTAARLLEAKTRCPIQKSWISKNGLSCFYVHINDLKFLGEEAFEELNFAQKNRASYRWKPNPDDIKLMDIITIGIDWPDEEFEEGWIHFQF